MKRKPFFLAAALMATALAVGVMVIAGLTTTWNKPDRLFGGNIPGLPSIALAAPAERPASATFLDSEAGMAAYANIGASINLANAKRAFKVTESERTDFIIGTVVVTVPQPERQKQPHVYVHKDGWMVAYLLKDESVGYAWPFGQNIKPPESILTTALNQVTGVAGISLPGVGYYNFKFPSANRVTVVNAADRIGSFEIQIPTAFQVFEAAETSGYASSSYPAGVADRTSGVKKGEFQRWTGALILVYREP
jgi:hypothetical protein